MTATTGFQAAAGMVAAPGNGEQANYTLNYPAGVAAGDLLIAVFCHDELGGYNWGAPQVYAKGWTALAGQYGQWADNSSAYGGIFVLTRIAGSETSAVFTTTAGGRPIDFNSDGMGAVIVNYGNAGSFFDGTPQLSIVSAALSGGSAPSAVVAPSITPHDSADLLICAFFAVPGSSTTTFGTAPSGMTQRYSVGPGGSNGAGIAVYDLQLASAAATGSHSLGLSAAGRWAMGASILLSYGTAPADPSLLTPAAGSSLDSSDGVPLTGVYNSTDQTAQSAYAARVKASGGSYGYYRASDATLQSTPVWNPISTPPGGTFTVQLPAALVPNGSTFNWSLASQNSLGAKQGAFAGDSTFTAEAGPTVVVNSPAATVTTPYTLIGWTTTCAAGSVQTYYRTVVYTSDQYGADGFVAGAGMPVWDSTKTTGAAQEALAGPLPNNSTCRAYVLATETGDVDGAWAYIEFDVLYDTPAAPSLWASAGVQDSPAAGAVPAGVVPYPVARLTVSGHDNLLPTDDASIEGSAGTWAGAANATVAQTDAWAADGVYSLAVTATAAGDATVQCDQVAVTAGASYTAWAVLRAAVTARTATLIVSWLGEDGGHLSTSTVSGADSASADLTLSGTVTAPANTVTAQVQIKIASAAAAEVHYADKVGLFPGTVDAWTRGGLAGLAKAYVTYDDGTGLQVPIRTAVNGITLPAPDQTVTVVDAEVIPGAARTYTAYVGAQAGTSGIQSAAADPATVTPPAAGGWTLIGCGMPAAGDPPAGVVLSVSNWQGDQAEFGAAHYGLGARYPVIITDVVGGRDGQFTVDTFDDVTAAILASLLTSQATLWLANPFGAGWYVRAGYQGGASASPSSPSTSPAPVRTVALPQDSGASGHRTWTLLYVEQPRPAGGPS